MFVCVLALRVFMEQVSMLLSCGFLMLCFLTSSDPQAAPGAGRFPGKGFRPDDTAECQCKGTTTHLRILFPSKIYHAMNLISSMILKKQNLAFIMKKDIATLPNIFILHNFI